MGQCTIRSNAFEDSFEDACQGTDASCMRTSPKAHSRQIRTRGKPLDALCLILEMQSYLILVKACKLMQVFLTPTHLGIAMEYAAGGELFDRIAKAGRFNEDEARFFFQQLISGVQYCHSQVWPLQHRLVEREVMWAMQSYTHQITSKGCMVTKGCVERIAESSELSGCLSS